MRKIKLFKYKKTLIAILLIAAVAATGIVLAKPKPEAEEEIIWREYKVSTGNITASLDGGGKLASEDVEHSFGVELKIDKVMFAVGDEVKKDDVLVKYNKDDIEKKINELKLSVGSATRTLEDAKNNKLKAMLQDELTKDNKEQDERLAYERKKRETENAIINFKNKLETISQKISLLQKDLRDAKDSADGTVDSDTSNEMQRLKNELKKLQDELYRLENPPTSSRKESNDNNTDHSDTSVISSDISANEISDNSEAIKRIKESIANIQNDISNLSSKESKINSIKEQLRQAREEYKAAEFELETQNLSLSDTENDYLRKNAEKEKDKITQDKIDSLTASGMDNAIKNAESELLKANNILKDAKRLINIPELTAKVGGIITKIGYTDGDTVPGGKSVVTIGSSGEKLVVTQIPQEDIGGIEVGQKVEMQFMSTPDQTRSGVVTKKSPIPTEGGTEVTYKVTISFDEFPEDLLQGMTCSVKFILKRVANVFTLSNKAITLKDGKQYVTLLLEDNTREEREIKTGFSDGRTSEIKSGLSDGDTVVVAG